MRYLSCVLLIAYTCAARAQITAHQQLEQAMHRVVDGLTAEQQGSGKALRDYSNAALASLVMNGDAEVAAGFLHRVLPLQVMETTEPNYGSLPWNDATGENTVQDENAKFRHFNPVS